MLVGDLDSADLTHLDTLTSTRIVRHPAHKDETDLELTLALAVSEGSPPFLLFGTTGGRLDQMLGNLLLLANPKYIAHDMQLIEPHQTVRVFADRVEINGHVGDVVSLLPLGGNATVAQTTGLAWELRDSVLGFGAARGVSNRMTNRTATVLLTNGIVACVHIDGQWQR